MNRPRKIAFIDTETTGLSHLSRAWEVAVILRETEEIDTTELGHAEPQSVAGHATDTEWLFQVEYTPQTLPEGTDPKALEIGGWRTRYWENAETPSDGDSTTGGRGWLYRQHLIGQGVNTACGPEWSVARSLHNRLEGATLVGVGVHYDAEVLGRMFLRHGLHWQPWHYGILDLKSAAWGYLRGLHDGDAEGYSWDQIPIRSETVAGHFVPPVPEDQRHTALGDARWARDWFDAL